MSPASDLFGSIGAVAAGSATLDRMLAAAEAARAIDIVFLWGNSCPNCEIAKSEMRLNPQRLTWPGVRWLHANVYDDPDLATRFGLHGIPVFLVFRGRRQVGRVTGWPGTARFASAIDTVLAAPGHSLDAA